MPAGTYVFKDGERKLVADSEIQEYRNSGWSLASDAIVETETGRKLVGPDDAEKLLREGGQLARTEGVTPERARYLEEQRKGQIQDPWSQSEALGAGILRGQTLGLSDLLLSETGVIDKERLAGLREEYSKTSLGGELAGMLTGAVAGAGPVGAVGRLGAKVGARAGGGIAGAALGGAAEGFVFGGAQAANNMYLADKPFSAEALLVEAGSGALFGGALGGGIGLLSGGARKLASRVTERGLAKANPVLKPGSEAYKRVSRTIGEAIEAPVTTRAAALKRLDDLAPTGAPYAKRATEAKAIAAEAQALDDTVREAVATRTKAGGFKIDLDKISKLEPDELAKIGSAATQSEKLTQQVAKTAGIEYVPSNLTSKLTEIAKQEGVPAASLLRTAGDISAVLETLEVKDTSKHIANYTGSELAGTIYNLWALGRTAKVLTGKGSSAGGASFLEKGARNFARFKTRTGLSGAIGNQPAYYVGNLVGNMGQSVGRAKETITTGVGKVLSAVGRPGTARVAIPSSTTILSKLTFDPNVGEKPDKNVFKQRSAELDRAMAQPQATADRVRKAVAPVTHIDPEVGQSMAALAMQKLAFYHSKAPRNPLENTGLNRVGRWEPPASEVARFGRYVRAGEDPLSLLADMESGRVSPEAVEAVKTLYPDTYSKMQLEFIEQLAEPGAVEKLSYGQRVQLAIFFELPTDPTLTPEFYATMQDNFVRRAEALQSGSDQYSTPGNVAKAPGVTEQPTAAQRLQQ